jgi:TorA maturation chaperone TorD
VVLRRRGFPRQKEAGWPKDHLGDVLRDMSWCCTCLDRMNVKTSQQIIF